MIELFDTHAHLDDEFFPLAQSKLVEMSRSGQFPSGVKNYDDFQPGLDFRMAGILTAGINLKSSLEAVDLAERFSILYAAVGIHPNSSGQAKISDWQEIAELSKNKQVAAIGETGLDKYWDTVPFATQLDYFERHLQLAFERKLPILIHSRDCDDEMLAVLGNVAKVSPIFGVIHSFSSVPDVAEKYLAMGLHVSFSGAVTYTNKKFASIREAAKIIPNDRLLIETDAPFLTPHPYRGKISKNEPIMVAYTARTLAELRNCSVEEIGDVTTKNAQKLFRKP